MNWLDNIQWQRDLGVDLRMMNNQLPPNRNKWYFDVLTKTVAGKNCLEIGFGAGLLSIMALQAGADHITAWEVDNNRFLLGQHIINSLDLSSKISLYHGKYDCNTKPAPDVVVFHEIIGPNIWREGMRSSLPLGDNFIVPAEYIMQLEIIRVSEHDFIKKFFPERKFNPEIPVTTEYITLINSLIEQSPSVVYNRDWYNSFEVVDTVDFYNINVNTIKSIPVSYTAGITLPISNTDRFILYPKSSICHDGSMLFWSYYNPLLVPKFTRAVTITQNFTTGEFEMIDTR